MKSASADVIIVGGGLCGAAIAYCCAARGIRVVLLERMTVGGGGATRHSRGIVRVYDPNPRLMAWSSEGAREWRRWSIEGPSPFHPCGVLYLLARSSVAAALAAVDKHADPEYPIIVLEGEALFRRFPLLRRGDRDTTMTQVGLFEPQGGYCDPRLAAGLYAAASRRLGASILEGASVAAIEWSDAAVEVRTDLHRLDAKIAVLAAGAHASELIPSLPMLSRTIPLTCLQDGKGDIRHCLIDERTGAYLRPEPPAHYFCGGARQADAGRPDGLPGFGAELHDEHRSKLAVLLDGEPGPALYGVAGFDGYTSDHLPLIGFRDEHPRLCLATGFSGRGAKYIPAVARHLGAAIAGRLGDLP